MRAHPLVADDELFDRPKALNVTSSLEHCLRFFPPQTSRVQDLNVRKSWFQDLWRSCAVVIITTPQRQKTSFPMCVQLSKKLPYTDHYRSPLTDIYIWCRQVFEVLSFNRLRRRLILLVSNLRNNWNFFSIKGSSKT